MVRGGFETRRIDKRGFAVFHYCPCAAGDELIVYLLYFLIRYQALDQPELVHAFGRVIRADQLDDMVDMRNELFKGGTLAVTHKRRPAVDTHESTRLVRLIGGGSVFSTRLYLIRITAQGVGNIRNSFLHTNAVASLIQGRGDHGDAEFTR